MNEPFRLSLAISLAGLAFLVCTPFGAAESESDETEEENEVTARKPVPELERTRQIEFGADVGGHLVRPDGWVEANPGPGAVALMRAAGVEHAQIELRVSADVPEDRSRRYFDAFHSKIQTAGFERVRGPEHATYGGAAGRESEYEGTAKEDAYRLVVWTHHRHGRAWVATAFFSKDARDQLYPDFRTAVESVVFPTSDGESASR